MPKLQDKEAVLIRSLYDAIKRPDGGGSEEERKRLLSMEKMYHIDYHEYICDAVDETHKLGGYPPLYKTEQMCLRDTSLGCKSTMIQRLN